MSFMILSSDNERVLCKPEFVGSRVRWKPLFEALQGIAEPWTFETRVGAERARDMHATPGEATVASWVYDKTNVAESEVGNNNMTWAMQA